MLGQAVCVPTSLAQDKNTGTRGIRVSKNPSGLRLDQSAIYQIRVQGRIKESWSHWFDDMEIEVVREPSEATMTILTGVLADQSALHGMLNRLRDLGIPLISVELIGAGLTEDSTGEKRTHRLEE